ncbi:substrate-binding domain-containing protein [Luteolibacter algae]|uniref:Substrate-binding domain-containing protein n=1 Tax=Luteolibacter algae TaxID=454151 RepID=A0ABW5D638_9BACT
MMDSSTATGRKIHIAILSGMQWAQGRNLVRGALRYCQSSDEAIQLDLLAGVANPTVSQLSNYDGMLTDRTEPGLGKIADTIPVLTVSASHKSPHLQHILSEERESGRIAATTLHDLRPSSYAIFADPRLLDNLAPAAIKDRVEGFQEELLKLGVEKNQIRPFTGSASSRLTEFLQTLPKPTAIFAPSDTFALEIIQTCHLLEIQIPQEAAVLSVGNDRLICSLCQPPLSSIDMRTEEIGYHALETLSRKIRERDPVPWPHKTLVPFPDLRESTGHLSSPNPTLQSALEAIRSSPDQSQLTAAQVARIAGTNLRSLEKLFQQHLHTTIRQKMLEIRLEKVKRLLRTTDLSVDEICERLGWEASALHHIFKRKQGQTATGYRKSLISPSGNALLPKVKTETLVVGFISPLADETGHDMLRGAQDFIRENPDIRLTLLFRSRFPGHAQSSTQLTGGESISRHDGFIATPQADVPAEILGKKPLVYFEHEREHPLNWSVHIDNRAVGEIAANHFLHKGYRHFAYCDYAKEPSPHDGGYIADSRSGDRFGGFRDELLVSGIPASNISRGTWIDDQGLVTWLKTLPKPCGIFAFNDALGLHLMRCCELASLRIPQDLAILGTDNSEFYCNTATPNLSSIDIGFRRAGYRIIEYLVKIIRAEPDYPQAPLRIPVRHVVERESTRGAATDDAAINAALSFIRLRHNGEISIPQIVKVSGISRRSLENRFKSILNRSILDEIQRARLDTAANLLTSTNLSINEIAALSGFKHTRHFCHLFKSQAGCSASQFRKRHFG